MDVVLAIVSFVLVLGVLVLVHELGHFLVARGFKVGVDEFGVGFPPRLFAKRLGKTLYSVNAIPVGGFVKIKGMSEGEDEQAIPGKSFTEVPRWQRLIILLAGIVMNYVLTAVLLGVGFMIGLPSYVNNSVPDGATILNPEAIVYEVPADALITSSGIQAGDRLISLDGQPIHSQTDLQTSLGGVEAGRIVNLTYAHEANEVSVQVTTVALSEGRTGLGLYIMDTGRVQLPFFLALKQGVIYTWQLTGALAQAVGQLFQSLVQGQNVSDQVSGPVGIASLTYQAAQAGLVYVLQLAALLSLNLALFNLLPFPPLDGGKLVVVLAEMITRRNIPMRWQIVLHNVGFLVFLVAIAVITFKDIFKLFA